MASFAFFPWSFAYRPVTLTAATSWFWRSHTIGKCTPVFFHEVAQIACRQSSAMALEASPTNQARFNPALLYSSAPVKCQVPES